MHSYSTNVGFKRCKTIPLVGGKLSVQIDHILITSEEVVQP